MGPERAPLIISMMLVGVLAWACAAAGGITTPREEQGRETPTATKQERVTERTPGAPPAGAGETLIVPIVEGGVPPRMVPDYIEVKKGSTVVFRFSGLDDQSHTFTATTLDVDLEVAAGTAKESKPIAFNQSTTVFFFCRFHRGVGSVGRIKVIN